MCAQNDVPASIAEHSSPTLSAARPPSSAAPSGRIRGSDDECLDWLWRDLYAADGVHALCDRCGTVRGHHRVTGRRAFACDSCGAHVYPTSGTFLESSRVGLSRWFRAVTLLVDSDGRAPAKRLALELGLSYRTALRMRSRILKARRERGEQETLVLRIYDSMGSGADRVVRTDRRAAGSPQATQTMERIRAAACKTFARHGLVGTRVADIAAEAGVSTATVHHYYGSKERVLLAALEWSGEQADAKAMRIRRETSDHLEALRRILLWYIPREGDLRDHYRLWLDVWVASERHPELMRSCAAMSVSWQESVRQLVIEGTGSGTFRPVAPAAEIAKRITSMMTGLCLKTTVGYEAWGPDQTVAVLFWFIAEQLGLPPAALGVHVPASQWPVDRPQAHADADGR